MVYQILGGRVSPLEPPVLEFGDAAVQFGAAGFFETLRVEHGRVHLFDRHLERLEQSLDAWGIEMPWGRETWIDAIGQELADSGPRGCKRLRLTAGPSPQGQRNEQGRVQGRGWVEVRDLPEDYRPPLAARPLYRVQIFRDYHLSGASPWAGRKSSQYWAFWEARCRAKARGYDEALLMNERGELVEASAFNLFWIEEGRLAAPAVECGGLPGIFAAYVIDLSRELGFEVTRMREGPEALERADAVFLTNSLGEIIGVRAVGDRAIAPPMKDALGRRLIEEVGRRHAERADLEIPFANRTHR